MPPLIAGAAVGLVMGGLVANTMAVPVGVTGFALMGFANAAPGAYGASRGVAASIAGCGLALLVTAVALAHSAAS
jgi:hypothetical protein